MLAQMEKLDVWEATRMMWEKLAEEPESVLPSYLAPNADMFSLPCSVKQTSNNGTAKSFRVQTADADFLLIVPTNKGKGQKVELIVENGAPSDELVEQIVTDYFAAHLAA